MFIASQRKPPVPATATNSPSVTNKIPIHFHEISSLSSLAMTKRRQQDSAEIELDHRDLLQEDEFERHKLVVEITEELRPQHPL